MKPIVLVGSAVVILGAAGAFLIVRVGSSAPPTIVSGPFKKPRMPDIVPESTSLAPDSENFPEALGRAPADRAANIASLLTAGDHFTLQLAMLDWFAADPAAAIDWLDRQPSFAVFQPALAQIAKDVASSGYPAQALEWAELLETGPDREQTIFEIYATGRRYRSLSDDQIRAAPFSPEQIAHLLSGAVDD